MPATAGAQMVLGKMIRKNRGTKNSRKEPPRSSTEMQTRWIQGTVEGKVFYCSSGGENSQRQLEESRAAGRKQWTEHSQQTEPGHERRGGGGGERKGERRKEAKGDLRERGP